MAGINKVIIVGNLGRDVETRPLNNGIVANFSVATSEKWRDKSSNEMKEQTEWHNISAFGKVAEICAEYLRKGSKVYIEGKLKTDKYEKDGQTHYSTKVIVRDMQMLDSKGEGGGQRQDYGQGQSQPAQQASPPIQDDDGFDSDIPF